MNETALTDRFNQLTSLQRGGEHAHQVNQVLRSHQNIEEKIKQIEKIDEVYARKTLGGTEINEREKKRLLKDHSIVTPDQALHILENLKKKNIRKRTLLFWGERGKLKNFSRISRLIKLGLLPASVRFSKDMPAYLEEVQASAKYMLPIMIAVLKVAWAYLSRKDYNLLQTFRKMCEELVVLDLNKISSQRDTVLIPFQYIEKYALLCHYHAEYPQIIQSSIILVINKYPDYASKLKNVENHLMNLLDISKRKHSLIHIILSSNMVAYGRYFDVIALTNSKYEEVVNTFCHDCDQEIEYKIKDFIDKRALKLEELLQTKEKINLTKQYIDQFLEKEENGEYSQKPLIEFYRSTGNSQVNFTADSKNISLFASNLLNRYLVSLWNIFIGYLEMERIDKLKVFSESLFQQHFINIRSLSERFEKAFFTKHNLSLERFVELRKKSESDISSTEMEILDVLDQFSHEVMSIAKKLAAISLSHQERGSIEQWQPLKETDLKVSQLDIPFWSYIITQAGFFNGWKFGNAMNFIISVCFLTGLFFFDKEFEVMLKKEALVDTKIEEVMLILERVCDPIQYEKIKRSMQP